ncbi:hypothetical protein [Martelella sp. HB161492]|uniref:hypothetical protein n=1 Tax=Martelella sp. HB161492 TaxID=2720726 RepID=UPI001590ED83|nr:hypothetical protein [Martelella sp. HB161492]
MGIYIGIAISLIAVFLVLSLVVTSSSSVLSSMLRDREEMLKDAIHAMVDDVAIREKTMRCGLVPGCLPANQNGAGRAAGYPAFIDTTLFARALLSSLLETVKDEAQVSGSEVDQLRQAVGKVSADTHLGSALRSLIATGEGSLKAFEADLGHWYDATMQRLSDIYRRRQRLICFLLGLGLATVLNADTLNMVDHLSIDSGARDAMVAAALNLAGNGDMIVDHCTPSAAQPADVAKPDQLQCLKEQAATLLTAVSPVSLGWKGDPLLAMEGWKSPLTWLRKIFGLLITAVAISLGAPFWFDLLRRIVGVADMTVSKRPAGNQGDQNP